MPECDEERSAPPLFSGENAPHDREAFLSDLKDALTHPKLFLMPKAIPLMRAAAAAMGGTCITAISLMARRLYHSQCLPRRYQSRF